MFRSLILCLLTLASALSESYSYEQSKVGEWNPPPPPQNEIAHLQNEPLFSFLQLKDDPTTLPPVAGVGASVTPAKKVPLNWFGAGKYIAPAYDVALGVEECDVCKFMIEAKEHALKSVGSDAVANPTDPIDVCKGIAPKYLDMCLGYKKYLDNCPSFLNNICQEDEGGAEKIRSPCPTHLKCYYCLRINPL